MMLGTAQKKALEILRIYGALRPGQLERLLAPQIAYLDMAAVKKQLLYYRLIRADSDYFILPDHEPNPALLEAVDVMLNFPVTDIQMHKPAPEPFLLTFFKNNKDGKLCRYDVCRCEPGTERILSAILEGLNEKYRTVLILLANLSQRKALHIIPENCFVVREAESHKFYKPAKSALTTPLALPAIKPEIGGAP